MLHSKTFGVILLYAAGNFELNLNLGTTVTLVSTEINIYALDLYA